MTRLSHSASQKYLTCPAMYRLHYIDRIRSHRIGSALLFGSALDEALNVLLATKLDKPTENATDDLERIKQGFDYHLAYQMINKELLDIRTSHYIDYFGSDFEKDILTEVELKSLQDFIRDAGYVKDSDDENSGYPNPFDLYDEISGYIKDKQEINSTDQSYYNYASWLSLKRKGHMMLEHYKDEIMPQIKRVISIQKKVNLPNQDGDVMIGYIDFEAELKGYEGIITLDNKTSSKKYKLVDINDNGQLLVYDEFTENGLAGYIVLMKKIKYHKKLTCQDCGEVTSRAVKSCPAMISKSGTKTGIKEVRCGGKLDLEKTPCIESQILVDNIQEGKKDLHFQELCGILTGIENNEFPQDRNECFQYGRKCIYYNYCRSNPANPDVEGLSKV